ncbi:MAG TPA: ABC transporter ATP-binding protein [Candidatus Dormibacteraeota bacterium]|nr:ABC transporter ATP-binding protein [Candidatus Dormibacteraeota bacterium]
MGAEATLRVHEVTKRFGGVTAVDRASLTLPPASILGLIGPNGSGKTTLLNVINGVHRPDSGTIELDGTTLVGRPPHRLVDLGLARTFQNTHVFKTLTVYQNMLLPTLHLGRDRQGRAHRALELLEFVGLRAHRDQPASELSGGQQKLLEFARALVTDPRVVLMDEPFAGIHPEIKALLLERIRERARAGTSFLIVSHEIPELMSLSDAMICLAQGRCIAAGTAAEVAENEQVIEAYLGHQVTA